jgi:hypothetical protein
MADTRLDPDAAARLLGETKCLRLSEARTFSQLFRGEKRFEDTGKHIVRNTDTGIGDGHANIVPWRKAFCSDRAAVYNGVERFKSQNATRLHGVSGVDGQVQDDRLNLDWIDQGRPKVRSHYRPKFYPAKCSAEQIGHLGDLAVEIKILWHKALLAREGKELPDEACAPFGSGADQLDTLPIAGITQIA